MMYSGNKASVPLGNGKWSPFMPIPDAEKLEHNMKLQRFLTMLRAGKQIMGLRNDIPAMMDAQDMYKAERRGAMNTPTQAKKAA